MGLQSKWDCTLEDMNLRLGLRYVRGLRVESGSGILRERQTEPFADIDDLARRVPTPHKNEMAKLAATGTLNPLNAAHRRDALWKSSRSARDAGPCWRKCLRMIRTPPSADDN
jgi:error-prone DNA polymerase